MQGSLLTNPQKGVPTIDYFRTMGFDAADTAFGAPTRGWKGTSATPTVELVDGSSRTLEVCFVR